MHLTAQTHRCYRGLILKKGRGREGRGSRRRTSDLYHNIFDAPTTSPPSVWLAWARSSQTGHGTTSRGGKLGRTDRGGGVGGGMTPCAHFASNRGPQHVKQAKGGRVQADRRGTKAAGRNQRRRGMLFERGATTPEPYATLMPKPIRPQR